MTDIGMNDDHDAHQNSPKRSLLLAQQFWREHLCIDDLESLERASLVNTDQASTRRLLASRMGVPSG